VCYFQPKWDGFRRKRTAHVEALEEAKTEIVMYLMMVTEKYAGI